MDTTPRINLTPTQRFWRLLKPDQKEITRIYLYAILHGLVNLSLPLGIQAIINFIQGGRISASWVVLVTIVILGIAFSGILQIAQLRVIENLQQRIFARSGFELAFRIPRIRLDQLEDKYAPELMNRFFDTVSIQKGMAKMLTDFSTATLQVFFGLILLSLYHPFFILFSIGLAFLFFLLVRFTGYKGMRTSLDESHSKYKVAHWLEEMARLNVTFKQSGATDLPLIRTDRYIGQYLKARESHFKVLLTQFRLMVGFKVIIAAALLVIGGVLVMEQQMNIGQFVAAEIIILLVISSIEKLITSFETIYDVLTSLEKLGQITDLELEDGSTGVRLSKDGEEGMSVEVSDLSFQYSSDSRKVLNHVNMKINSGDRLVITGQAGSGKSTLIGVLSTLLEPQKGSVSYNGFTTGSLDKESLRSMIGHFHGRDSLFHGTLEENITMGREGISEEHLMDVIRAMQLDRFVKGLPEGIFTYLNPEGISLPRSTAIKIVLARSIVHQPKLLLLEDYFGQLDPDDRSAILQFLMDKKRPWTLVIASSDPIVLESCNRCVVATDHKIEELKNFEG